MSLKSIRDSYSRFLTVLKESGVKLSESQKGDLDSFILAIESKMSSQKKKAIEITKKVVTEHLDQQYKEAFESFYKHLQENQALASKIQSKVIKLNESKKIASKVSDYLDLYVESVLPKRTIIDYDRMQKLETIQESLKDLLLVNEDAVQAKNEQLAESFNADKKQLETQIAKLQVKLNESSEKNAKLAKKVDQFKAMELLESKTKDLPSFEARQLKKRLAESTTSEIESNFKKVLESVKDEMKEEAKEEELSIEDEVKDILEAEKEVKEDDLLKNRPHNAHVSVSEDEEADDKEVTPADEDEEEFTTTETVKFDEDGEVELDESEMIDAELMKLWCNQARVLS